MGGIAAYEGLCRLGAEVPVVLMSGHSEDVAVEEFGDKRRLRFLQKPFCVDTLLESVNGVPSQN
jgi:FixJ family two-component response regulator